MPKQVYETYNKMYGKIPAFLEKYLETPSIKRLKNIGYFCGMDYASKDIYDFCEYISRYDHSLNVALITWKYTHDKKQTIAALYHDVATPCFSHVIDYLNKDYETQESTEAYTNNIIDNDIILGEYLKKDELEKKDIYNFKDYSVVDTKRPKLCADRFDGLILTGYYWTKSLSLDQIKNLVDDLGLFINEDNEYELGFINKETLNLAINVNDDIDKICHSNEDNYMMELLAKIVKRLININAITYESLFILDEPFIFNLIENYPDVEIQELYNEFKNKKKEDIPTTIINNIKKRTLKPLINGQR